MDFRHEWTDVCGFVKHPNSRNEWLIRKHGAFEIDRKELGLLSKDQTRHYETLSSFCHINSPCVSTQRDRSRLGGVKRRMEHEAPTP